jgi:long-chain acyl-CoA synthetase
VLVFPEGQRTQGDLQNFRAGIGLLAQETQADVLPVALAGLGALKTGRRRRWLRFGASEVRIGPVEHFTPDQTPDAIAAELEQTIRNLLRGH